MTGIVQARVLTYYRRAASLNPAIVPPSTKMLPRQVFEGHTDVLAEYDELTTLNAEHRNHLSKVTAKSAAADAAAVEYKNAVRDALAAGNDPSKIKSKEPQLRAEVEAHQGFARDAKTQATATGHRLGPLMQEAAPDCLAPSEAILDAAALDVRASVEELRRSWKTWGEAWNIRQNLSRLHVTGGTQVGYNETPPLPSEVATAIATIEKHLNSLEVLKSDEREMAAWRETETEALAQNARALGRKPATA